MEPRISFHNNHCRIFCRRSVIATEFTSIFFSIFSVISRPPPPILHSNFCIVYKVQNETITVSYIDLVSPNSKCETRSEMYALCIASDVFDVLISLDFPFVNPSNAELDSICHLLALSGAHHIFHVSGLRVNSVCRRCIVNRVRLVI
jgi:hypothetical protein